jgi:hypothetical protein
MQDLMANGNYAPYLTQALTPPIFGAPGTMSGYGGLPGIGPQIGNPTPGNPVLGPFGQGSSGQNGVNFGTVGGVGQQGFGQQIGQPQPLAAQQQQQIATTLHQLAHHVATQSAIGQQVGGTLQQLAQHCMQQVMTGQQFAQLLNQLAHQCAWHAQAARIGGIGTQAIQSQPFGYGLANPVPYGQPGAQAWGFNRPVW